MKKVILALFAAALMTLAVQAQEPKPTEPVKTPEPVRAPISTVDQKLLLTKAKYDMLAAWNDVVQTPAYQKFLATRDHAQAMQNGVYAADKADPNVWDMDQNFDFVAKPSAQPSIKPPAEKK